VDADAVVVVAGSEQPIDLLYLDLDDPLTGKADYRRVLAAASPRLRPGSLILAHDPCVATFERDFEAYHELVHESGLFSDCWVFPVDDCGLSVAVTG
jgi:predicted O-methyltransferase YrrM